MAIWAQVPVDSKMEHELTETDTGNATSRIQMMKNTPKWVHIWLVETLEMATQMKLYCVRTSSEDTVKVLAGMKM